MWSRKKHLIKSTNLIAEERYLSKKFILEDTENNGLPEFQVTPAEEPGTHKIKYTWKNKNVDLPKDVRDDEYFSDNKFQPLTKIYFDQKEAQMAVNDFLRTKSYLFKD